MRILDVGVVVLTPDPGSDQLCRVRVVRVLPGGRYRVADADGVDWLVATEDTVAEYDRGGPLTHATRPVVPSAPADGHKGGPARPDASCATPGAFAQALAEHLPGGMQRDLRGPLHASSVAVQRGLFGEILLSTPAQ